MNLSQDCATLSLLSSCSSHQGLKPGSPSPNMYILIYLYVYNCHKFLWIFMVWNSNLCNPPPPLKLLLPPFLETRLTFTEEKSNSFRCSECSRQFWHLRHLWHFRHLWHLSHYKYFRLLLGCFRCILEAVKSGECPREKSKADQSMSTIQSFKHLVSAIGLSASVATHGVQEALDMKLPPFSAGLCMKVKQSQSQVLKFPKYRKIQSRGSNTRNSFKC